MNKEVLTLSKDKIWKHPALDRDIPPEETTKAIQRWNATEFLWKVVTEMREAHRDEEERRICMVANSEDVLIFKDALDHDKQLAQKIAWIRGNNECERGEVYAMPEPPVMDYVFPGVKSIQLKPYMKKVEDVSVKMEKVTIEEV